MQTSRKEIFAMTIFVLFIVVSLYHFFSKGILYQAIDLPTIYEKRFEQLKKITPQRGVFGYSTEPISSNNPYFIERATMGFYLTQYALAPRLARQIETLSVSPRVVEPTITDQFIIGDFHTPLWQKIVATTSLRLIKDTGNGVILFSPR
ncbi:MAG: hypothetical protein HYW78_00875 [Parcubacteria group bacterium]|nr:hypothetical protein [Parcubacteria group bacterium]